MLEPELQQYIRTNVNMLGLNLLKFQEYIRNRHIEISICQEFQQCELIETSTTQYDKTY